MNPVQLHAVLYNITAQTKLSTILDTLADIATQNAEDTEALDTRQAEQWDKASGMLVVLATRLGRVSHG
jgi:hypothetical protein